MRARGWLSGLAMGVVLTTAAMGHAQTTGYPQQGTDTDPRAASKAPAYPSQAGTPNYSAQPAAPSSGYDPRQQAVSGGQPTTGYLAPQYPSAPTQVAYPTAQSTGSMPAVLAYRDGMDAPAGYVLESSRNGALMTAGGLTFGVAYGGGLFYAAGKSFSNGTGWLAAPVVGPWVAISKRKFQCKSSSTPTKKDIDTCVDGALGEVTSITFLAMLGMVQAVGTTLFFAGVGDTDQQWVRADLAGVELQAAPGPVGSTGHGLTLSGKF